MNFLDEVKKAQERGRTKPDEEEKAKLREVDSVVNALVSHVKREILKEAEKAFSNFSATLYFCVPSCLGNSGPFLYERKTIWSGSGYSGCWEYSPTKYLTYLQNELLQKLQLDDIAVSKCFIGTIEHPYRDASKNIGKTSLGLSIEYSASDTFGSPQLWSNRVYIHSVYNQFSTTQPVRAEQKNALLGFVETKKIIQNGVEQKISKDEQFQFMIKISFSGR